MDKETLQLLLQIKEIVEQSLYIKADLLSQENMQQDMSAIKDMIETHLLERINK